MARDIADELLQAKVKARLFGGDHAPRLGRLVILDRIGSGAMGAVYAAYDPRLDRQVAVKVLHAGDAESNARWLGETRALGKLAHPNVIAIHDANIDGDAVHIVMELATGTPLRAWIHKERTWRDVVRVMRDAGTGLAAAHRAGIVHRDVKPDNIIVGDTTRVVDFGLAQTAGDDRDEGAGTPSYMAPEVLGGGAATAASDQFSFGVTLFEALYGERPHAGASRDELRAAALLAASARPGHPVSSGPRADAQKPTETPDGTVGSADAAAALPIPVVKGRSTEPPAWLHAIVRRALAAEPEKRFPSMDDLVTALSRDRRRARVIAAVAVGALAIGVIGGALAMRGTSAADTCDGSARRASMWNDARAARIRAALGTSNGGTSNGGNSSGGTSNGGTSSGGTSSGGTSSGGTSNGWIATATAAMGATAQRWQTTFHGVCEATRVRGEQSDRLLELRMRCLDRALDRFDALAAALEGPLDATARAEAAAAIAQLPPPEGCARIVDAAELALPADPAQRERVLAAQHMLDLGWTNFGLSRYREARAQVRAVEATNLDADGLRAEIYALSATIEARIGEPAVARYQLERALAATAKARAFELEHVVWTRLLRHELFAGNPAHAIEWAGFARAAALRAGLDGAEIDGIVGEALRDAGQFARARDALDRALGSADPLRGDQWAIIQMNLGSIELAMGQPFLAQAAFERALAVAKSQLGDGHPSLAIYRDKLAEADRARGRIASALAHHDASLALRTAAYGDDDRSVATARFHRAETLIEAGELARAVADLEAARAIRVKLFGESSARLGEIDAALGDVEQARGKRTEALAFYERAGKLDTRLDLRARRAAAEELTNVSRGVPTRDRDSVQSIPNDEAPPKIDPFSVERAPRLVTWMRQHDPRVQREFAQRVQTAWRSARTEDPTLTLATADVLEYVDPVESATLYRAVLDVLPDEPSRMRLHALRGLSHRDPDAPARADALAKRMPELTAPW